MHVQNSQQPFKIVFFGFNKFTELLAKIVGGRALFYRNLVPGSAPMWF